VGGSGLAHVGDGRARDGHVKPTRVALDLDGSLDALSNSMAELAMALAERGDLALTTFRTQTRATDGEWMPRGQRLWRPWWDRNLGPRIDRRLPPVDVVHVAGESLPPTTIPLIVSVDDLRPLRRGGRRSHRAAHLTRAVGRGAQLVVSSRSAGHEVQDALGLERAQFTVVRPPVGSIPTTEHGRRLVMNVVGSTTRFLAVAPAMSAYAAGRGADLVVIGNAQMASTLRTSSIPATFLHRTHAREALAHARVVVVMSDGARFPAFAIAALGAGVPVVARSSELANELLGGAATLVSDDAELVEAVDALWDDEPRRAIARAAGQDRASDFAPQAVASVYATLYASVARGSK